MSERPASFWEQPKCSICFHPRLPHIQRPTREGIVDVCQRCEGSKGHGMRSDGRPWDTYEQRFHAWPVAVDLEDEPDEAELVDA